MLLLIFTAILSFESPSATGDVVYVEFTRKTSFDDLVHFRADLASKNITMDYLHIEFNDAGQLSACADSIIANTFINAGFKELGLSWMVNYLQEESQIFIKSR